MGFTPQFKNKNQPNLIDMKCYKNINIEKNQKSYKPSKKKREIQIKGGEQKTVSYVKKWAM